MKPIFSLLRAALLGLPLLSGSALYAQSNCLQIQCWTNIVVTSCTNVPVFYFPTATDNCCTNSSLVLFPPSGSSFAPRTTTAVTCLAYDSCGNTNTCSFTVTVNDSAIAYTPAEIPLCTDTNGCALMPDATSRVWLLGSNVLWIEGDDTTVSQSIAPGTLLCSNTNVIFSAMGTACPTNISVPVVLLPYGCCCISTNTILQFLEFPAPNVVPVSGTIMTLPGYGRVQVSWTCSANNFIIGYSTGNGAGTTQPQFTYGDPYGNPYPLGGYSWAAAPDLGIFKSNAAPDYTVTFTFLDGPPDTNRLFLDIAGLYDTSTATVSQPGYLAGEYQIALNPCGGCDPNGPQVTAVTLLDSVTETPGVPGAAGTIISSANDPAGIFHGFGDQRNTGIALFQVATNVASNTLTVSMHHTLGDGLGLSLAYSTNPCPPRVFQVQGPGDIQIDSCTNVRVAYPQPVVTDPCCGTNWSVVFDPPSGTSFAPGTHSLVNWFVYDCSGTNFVAAGSFLVSVFCTNCCVGPITNYTVTVVQGSNYLADCLCQGTNNTLADVLTNVPVGTKVYFWNPTAGQFNPPDTFTAGGWQNGTEPLVPGEGFLLVSFTNQYQLTIYGVEPGCGGACLPLDCFSDTVLVGDHGIVPNPVDVCDLICCPPVSGTEVRVWDATSQSFTTYTYSGTWSPPPGPPPLPVGYSEFVSVDTRSPVINCPGNIVTNSCTSIPIFFTVTASNAFGGALTATANPPSGSLFNVGTTNVTCAVTNACGRVSTCSFTVTVLCPNSSAVINVSQSGGTFNLMWPAGQGWTLQFQTNGLNPNSWMTVTGILDGSYSITVDPSRPNVFYRLKYP